MKPTAIPLLTAVTVSLLVSCHADCQTQTAVNGNVGNYMEVINDVRYAAECEARCSATAGCNVFKHCNSAYNCKNYWSRGGPDDAYMSCTLATGPFDARPPNDDTVTGFTIGQCSGSATPDATPAPTTRACQTQTAVNGNVGNYMEVIDNVAYAADCEAKCSATAGCNVFKYCNSVDNCKNYWSRGGPDDAYMSCTLATGPFDARPPNDDTVAGFTIGQCA